LNDAVLSSLFEDENTLTVMSQRTRVPRGRVKAAANFVDNSGLLDQLEKWAAEDAATRGAGGRPPSVSMRTVLIALFVLALEGSPLLVTRMADLLDHRLKRSAAREFGLDGHADLAQWYFRIWRAGGRFRSIIDPMPGARYNRQTKMEWAATLAARDPNIAATKQARLDWFNNQLLEATYHLLPAQHRTWSGNITVDATPVSVFGRSVRKTSTRLSSEPDAAIYRREGDHRDSEDKTKKSRKLLYGWEMELLIQSTNDPNSPKNFPHLVLGVGFHKPGHAPAESAVEAFRSIRDRGHPAGYAIGDRLYSPGSKPHKYQLPVRALGYQLVHDFTIDQLGIKGGYAGAIQVEGAHYCPALGIPLINASADFRAGTIDEETALKRIDMRTPFLLRRKEKPDADGNVTMVCPAAGPNPTVSCPLKAELLKNRTGKTPSVSGTGIRKTGAKMLPPVLNPPEHPDRICTQGSVNFPVETDAKYRQPVKYQSEQWYDMYSKGRNTIEGFNGYVKDGSNEALAIAGRRRMRGYTAQYVLATILVAASNIRGIITFLNEERSGRDRPPPIKGPPKRREITLADNLEPMPSTSLSDHPTEPPRDSRLMDPPQ